MFSKAMSLIGLTAALFSSAPADGSAFCEGFQAGYKAGYCYRQFSCLPPLPPLCPLPDIGESTYQDGYNRGFVAGLGDK